MGGIEGAGTASFERFRGQIPPKFKMSFLAIFSADMDKYSPDNILLFKNV